MNSNFICQVDHLALHSNALFCFGWALEGGQALESAELVMELADGRQERVRVDLNRFREDVALAFPEIEGAANAGFLVVAGWSGAALQVATIEFFNAQDVHRRFVLTIPEPGTQARPKSLRYLSRLALAYLRSGRVDILLEKLRNYSARDMAQLPARHAHDLKQHLAGQHCRLVIDHAMGGGANLYRQARVQEWVAGGDTVVLLSFKLDDMSLRATVYDSSKDLTFTLSTLDQLQHAFKGARLREIFMNCAVSFPQPADLQAFLLRLASASGADVVVAVHDYFLTCPSQFLLNEKGNYCGLPDTSECASCLPSHLDGFVSLAGVRAIEHWRNTWGRFLDTARHILCFSPSSRRLLESVYPHIHSKIVLRPHVVSPLKAMPRRQLSKDGLVIGVVGSISNHKGALIVDDLLRAIRASKSQASVVVIGSFNGRTAGWSEMRVTGPYVRERLPDLLRGHDIDLVLFPSVCPETFSYVAHELCGLGIPLACFDLGAQADLVRSYAHGYIARHTEGPALLQELIEFGRTLTYVRKEDSLEKSPRIYQRRLQLPA